ncbi:MAG: zf-HC2 domain-containing protein [Candidatus Gastranaerophilales bacterium]|nr:zf-HC2 domain-containing protein [Candidatus Gastranaerophilales bacterium]
MKITCEQFEGLISFYLNDELSENLRTAFEEHLSSCPACHIRFNMLSSIINELKDAYNRIITEETPNNSVFTEIDSYNNTSDDIQGSELSAYIDNELNDEYSVKIRRNIIARPKLRKKIERLYNLRKIIIGSFDEQKDRLKTDYSKTIMKDLNGSSTTRQAYFHCIVFIVFVIGVILLSSILIARII